MATRTCIVAGVGPGIGLSVSKRFAREGFQVALLARREAELAGLAREVSAVGAEARGYAVDLSDADAVRATLNRVATELGSASALVYNAAAWNEADAMTLDPAAFAADLALSVTGALVCVQTVYPAMKARRDGVILFTGGGLALRPEYGETVPSLVAGKSALRGLAFALAPRLAKDGLRLATVTVAGLVQKGTAFDPERIADVYYQLYERPLSGWTTEIVFDGK
jgi:NAD(P)-dependent dehydrogenase (short-subunit alcohol dehydrogenase family)